MNHSFIRFLMVGVINTIVGLSLMYGFMHVAGLSYWMSTFSGNAAGAGVSYLLNKTFTFQHRGNVIQSGVRFVLVILSCYFLAYFTADHLTTHLFSTFDDLKLVNAEDAAVLVGTIFYTVLNYLGQRKLVFPEG